MTLKNFILRYDKKSLSHLWLGIAFAYSTAAIILIGFMQMQGISIATTTEEWIISIPFLVALLGMVFLGGPIFRIIKNETKDKSQRRCLEGMSIFLDCLASAMIVGKLILIGEAYTHQSVILITRLALIAFATFFYKQIVSKLFAKFAEVSFCRK